MIRVPASITIPEHYFTKTADIIVKKVGDRARAVDKYGNLIAESTDYVYVWQKAVDNAPDNGVVVGLGEFISNKWVDIQKPLTIVGGKFVRDPSVGSNAHHFFRVGNGKGEPIVDGPVRFINCYFDGNERNISQTYTEAAGAPVHTGIVIRKVRKVIIEGCVFKDMAREAIWATTIENTEGVIDHEEIIVRGNYFENVAYVITAESYRKLVFEANIIRGINSNGDNVANRSYAVSPNYLDCLETVIANNVIDGKVPDGYPYAGTTGKYGISTGGEVTIDHVTIVGNVISNVREGIYWTKNNAVIIGNTVRDVVNGIDLYVSNDNIVAFNKITRFTNIGIVGNGISTKNAERNLIAYNYLDTEDLSAEYGIRVDTYAQYNIIVGNIVRGTYNTSPESVWVDKNLADFHQLGTGAFTNLSNNMSGFPFERWGIVPMIYFDGTYYYLVIPDPVNKVLRKVQLS